MPVLQRPAGADEQPQKSLSPQGTPSSSETPGLKTPLLPSGPSEPQLPVDGEMFCLQLSTEGCSTFLPADRAGSCWDDGWRQAGLEKVLAQEWPLLGLVTPALRRGVCALLLWGAGAVMGFSPLKAAKGSSPAVGWGSHS